MNEIIAIALDIRGLLAADLHHGSNAKGSDMSKQK